MFFSGNLERVGRVRCASLAFASNHFRVSAFSMSALAAFAVPYVPDSGRIIGDAALDFLIIVYHICNIMSSRNIAQM